MKRDPLSLLTPNTLPQLQKALGDGAPSISLVQGTSPKEEDWILKFQTTRQGMLVSARPKRGGSWRSKAQDIPATIWEMVRGEKTKSGLLLARRDPLDIGAFVKQVKRVLMVMVRIIRPIKDALCFQAVWVCQSVEQKVFLKTDAPAHERREFLNWCFARQAQSVLS